MSATIQAIPLGMNQCYVIQDQGTIMIDGGFPGKARSFEKALAETAIKPPDIQLVILTHGHFDHVGSAKHIRGLTGARIAMHRADKEQLEKDRMTWSPGVTAWGRISRALFKPMMSMLRFQIPPIDLILDDDGLSLAEDGIR